MRELESLQKMSALMDYRGIVSAKPLQPGRGVPRRGAGLGGLGPCPREELHTRDRAGAVSAGGTHGLSPRRGTGAGSSPGQGKLSLLLYYF